MRAGKSTTDFSPSTLFTQAPRAGPRHHDNLDPAPHDQRSAQSPGALNCEPLSSVGGARTGQGRGRESDTKARAVEGRLHSVLETKGGRGAPRGGQVSPEGAPALLCVLSGRAGTRSCVHAEAHCIVHQNKVNLTAGKCFKNIQLVGKGERLTSYRWTDFQPLLWQHSVQR
ncbi:hypothetical protein HJG60_008120 [Phyllostomus discolor]|uniref:Uncharacterized protein n=1 Tax=Phyllostomus discolor TaxID=89673 RepID=A0A834DQB6_9CHIR|nr:hypothetical protein HJG60_008120 [Phyllostomus discolor]